MPVHKFQKRVEEALDEIEALLGGNIPEEQRRFYAVKLFERDNKIGETISGLPDVESIIIAVEKDLDDDSESIITNERYTYIGNVTKKAYNKRARGR